MNAMSTEADIVERLTKRANAWRLNSDMAWISIKVGDIRAALDEIARLRAERDDWKRVAECNDAFLQAAKEGHPITIVPPDDARAAARDMRERATAVAEYEHNVCAQQSDQAKAAGLRKDMYRFNTALHTAAKIAERIRALPDTPGDQQP